MSMFDSATLFSTREGDNLNTAAHPVAPGIYGIVASWGWFGREFDCRNAMIKTEFYFKKMYHRNERGVPAPALSCWVPSPPHHIHYLLHTMSLTYATVCQAVWL